MRLKFSVDGKHFLVTNANDATISINEQHSKNQIKITQLHLNALLLERLLI